MASPAASAALQVQGLREKAEKLKQRRQAGAVIAKVTAASIAAANAVALVIKDKAAVESKLEGMRLRVVAAEEGMAVAEKQVATKAEEVEKLKVLPLPCTACTDLASVITTAR